MNIFRSSRVAVVVLILGMANAPRAEQVAEGGPSKGGAGGARTYIVQLSELPVVAYPGGIPGLEATRPARGQKIDPNDPRVRAYAAHLDARHDQVLGRVGGQKVYDHRYAFNGFTARLTPGQAAQLRNDPAVVSIEETQEVVMDTATTPTFLGLLDPTSGVWTARGIKGEGVVIGIVDSGIWPESESFSDRTGTGPNNQQSKLGYQQIPGWHGRCVPGEAFNASHCNQKLIGAQYFCASRGCETVLPHEFMSPRDYNGHGTHTASTAGGNQDVPVTGAASLFGTVSGIAPRARVAAYKVCWDNGAGGCGANTGDSVAAIDQAVVDGVDVINYSISGTRTNYLDAVEVAYLFAGDAGVFVATSAGNSGPGLFTVAHISPWLASVAAGTHNRSGTATVTLGNRATYTGASLTPAAGPAPIVLATASGLPGADPNLVRQCFSAAANGNRAVLDPSKVAGKIVLCQRGGGSTLNARVDKSAAVREAGGVGTIIYNVAAGASLNADLHSLPTVHVNNVAGEAIAAYAAATGATAALSQGVVTLTAAPPEVAAFSSRGPSIAGLGDILKPDFMLPGVDILAAVAPPGNGGKSFDLYSGTSMSSPHVAGVAALLTEAHPDWSPAAMRSAMATTAHQSIPAYSPFGAGAGQVQPNRMLDPGLVYDAGFGDYLSFLKGQGLIGNPVPPIDASDLNLYSIAVGDLAGIQTLRRTVTNVGRAGTYTATVAAPAGFEVSVNPSSFTIGGGAAQSFEVTVTRTTGPLNTYRFGSLTWSDGTHSVRSPIVIRPVALAVPAEVSGTGTTGALSYAVKIGYAGALAYNRRGLVGATRTLPETVMDDPTNNFDIANPDANQGIKTHDVAVPAGSSYLRVALFDADTDGAHDLDLYVYRVNADASKTLVGFSGGSTSAEQVNLANPTAATYRVYVHGWQTDGPDAEYRLSSWILARDESNFRVSGPTTATIGGTGRVDVSWSDLAADTRYLGQIVYLQGATAHATTIVRVE